MSLSSYRYTQGAMEALATHYFDDHEDVTAIDAYADFDRSLGWLKREAPELELLLQYWMRGHMETDLACGYSLRPRTLARLLDQTFLLLAAYLNDDRPLEIPVLSALQREDQCALATTATTTGATTFGDTALIIALTSLSMTFSFMS